MTCLPITPWIREHLDRLKEIALATGDFELIGKLQIWACSLDGASMGHDALAEAVKIAPSIVSESQRRAAQDLLADMHGEIDPGDCAP